MVVWAAEERVRFARSQAVRSRRTARALRIATEVFLVLALELLGKVGDETVIEVLATKVSITGSGLDLEDTLLDSQERDIEGSSAEIEDEDVALASGLLIKTVGDGSCRGLVDDTKDVETSNGTGILGGETLRVVEVSRDATGKVSACRRREKKVNGLT